ncbi:hypothetical protein L596_009929 [Steinernema carpocapsae]|uniref:Uncharacterized protein n=1 Tax=Steinernema carpocapsae TaxID=34508 RepID=A0A4U5PGR4_STECR|nr:hypothetical protein L596_009929 [Steinernema carpocapsae]
MTSAPTHLLYDSSSSILNEFSGCSPRRRDARSSYCCCISGCANRPKHCFPIDLASNRSGLFGDAVGGSMSSSLDNVNPYEYVRCCCGRSIHIVRLAKIVYCLSLLTFCIWFLFEILIADLNEEATFTEHGINSFLFISGLTCYVMLWMATFKNYNKALITLYFFVERKTVCT